MILPQQILCFNGYHERKQTKHTALRTLGLSWNGKTSKKDMLPVPTMHSDKRVALKNDGRWQHQLDTRITKTELQEQYFKR